MLFCGDLTILLLGLAFHCFVIENRKSLCHSLGRPSRSDFVQFQFIDMKEKGMSKGEFTSVAQANSGLENMINWECKDKDMLALIKYIANEDKLEKVLENPQVIKTPVVRNGKQSTLGYQPDIWKDWK